MKNCAVILAGGEGKRMKSDKPKTLSEVLGRPMLCWVMSALRKAGIDGTGRRSPRLYDFRHTFATHRLYHWMREGKDLNAMLPYLSAYMGHAQLSDTYYYIHLVPGLLEEMSGLAFSSAEAILPEVRTDE